MVFYTDEYFVQEDNISVGGSFFCQYPDEDTLMRCAVMRDYGEENNKNVMKMWENFKSDPLPTWAIILFIVLIAGGLALAGYFIYNAVMKKKTRLAIILSQKKSQVDYIDFENHNAMFDLYDLFLVLSFVLYHLKSS